MRKLAILLIALMLLLTSMVPALAVNITVKDDLDASEASNSEFAVYRLLDLTTSQSCGNTSTTDHVHDPLQCYRYAYTVNEAFQNVLAAETGKTESADIVAYINVLNPADPIEGDQVRTFADNIYRRIQAADLPATATNDKGGSFTDLEQGYYLIVETKLVDGESYSLVMLDTAGQDNVNIKTKKSIPTVVKQVKEKNDSTTAAETWGSHADHDIGDAVEYTITGTLPSDYASYNHYTYKFVDTLSKGLAIDGTQLANLKVYAVNGNSKVEIPRTDTSVTNFTATTESKEITPEGSTSTETVTVLTVNFDDLKAIKKDANGNDITIDKDTKIVVEYSATLDADANIGVVGNKNTVVLVYENNPYFTGDGDRDTGETEPDTTIVFTFAVTVNKVDEATAPVAGAGFTLYKYDANATTEDKWVAVGEEITGVTTFEFEGLDAGEYKLEESTVPDGYNKAQDIFFEIVPKYSDNADPGEITELKVLDHNNKERSNFTINKVDDKIDGTVTTNVVNTTGVKLPATGGIGTTIFYVAGGLLVLAAVALLITRKCIFHSK